jgi:hypothetical protein
MLQCPWKSLPEIGNHLEVVKISTLALKKVWLESQEKYPLGCQAS